MFYRLIAAFLPLLVPALYPAYADNTGSITSEQGLQLTAPGEMGPDMQARNIEERLVKSLLSINHNRLDVAMNEVDSLLSANPNFKLAQLVKGDLLLARAQAISSFGNIPGASHEQMEELREEARVRLQRVKEKPPELTPKYLWRLEPRQHYALVVDTSKSTLYLFENVDGEARYVEDYYISIGKGGAEKNAEGDQKTPLGVYFVNDSIPRSKLTDFYGSGAYPLNYPNEWDYRLGRSGHGIWLHGTPADTYSRPPRSSNGCVVLSNEDLEKVGKVMQIGITPVIITSRMDWSNAEDREKRDELLHVIEQWRSDWASINTEAYLKHYAQDFISPEADIDAWSAHKKVVNAGKSWIKVGLSNLSMFAYPGQPDLVVVNFDQDYASNNLSGQMKKRQYWIRRNNRWQIIYEGAV